MDLRCFCGRLIGHVERQGDDRLLVTGMPEIAGRGFAWSWIAMQRQPGGTRRRPATDAPIPRQGPASLSPKGVLYALCPRHGDLVVSAADIDRSLRHGRKVHKVHRT